MEALLLRVCSDEPIPADPGHPILPALLLRRALAVASAAHFTSKIFTGSERPFTIKAGRDFRLKPLPNSPAVDCEIRIWPPAALDIRREAVFTVSPMTV